jgi:hypothetical protein
MIFIRILILLLAMIIPLSVGGKTKPRSSKRELAELLAIQADKIEELERIVLELKAAIEKAEREDEMRKLLEDARKLAVGKKDDGSSMEERKFYSGLRHHSALNPNISLGGDYYFAYGTSDSEYNRVPSENSWGTGRFFLREMELALEAPLDPYSRGKAYLSFGEEGVALEEGYMEWLNWPLNMNLKLGEFKTQFGVINRYHDHALPQFERPPVMSNFFGYTTLKGLGIAANFLLPSMTAQVNELDLQVITGGADQSFTSEGKHNLIYVAHFKNYWDLSRSTYVEFGLSGALGHNDSLETYRTTVGGVDLRLKWSPPDRSKYRGIEWWTEALYSRRREPDSNVDTWGMFSLLQCRLGARWLFGCRFDYSQLPFDDGLEEYGGAVNLDYWQSEFVFVRLQYTRLTRNFDEDDNRFILQISWAMGPHKHEAY